MWLRPRDVHLLVFTPPRILPLSVVGHVTHF